MNTSGLHRACVVSVLYLLLAGCGQPNERLDEHLFYDGPELQLKVVRYYRNIPFSQLGETAVVMCRSENTRDFPSPDPQDKGWRILGEAGSNANHDAADIAQRVKHDYQVFDQRILAASLQVLNISFDGCGHFIGWDPTRLPKGMIDAVKRPESCAPQGIADCRYLDFEADRTPRYADLQVRATREVSFTVSSPAFNGVQALQVHTPDRGELWHVDTLSGNLRELDPALLKTLSVSDDAALSDWLAALLPSQSMLIWPDHLAPCGTGSSSAARCATVHFNDVDGNNGELNFAISGPAGTAISEPAFHSGRYTRDQQSRSLGSLRELAEVLPRR
ncbi:MAG: hypothetical protein RQ736_00665 [Thiogranum sp.]|nr:hypothetical protein [Thiogranum sp.]